MEYAIPGNNKIELIQIAIQQLLESKQTHQNNNDQDHQLLSSLLSQLEALKADGVIDPSEPLGEWKEVSSCKSDEAETKRKDEAETSGSNTAGEAEDCEDVVKELKKLKKQNKITHWLLSTLIFLTLAWQVSEVSLLLKLKEGVSHPFRSLGNMFAGLVNRPRSKKLISPLQSLSANDDGNDSLLKLPNLELPDLVMNDEKQ